MKNTVSEKGGRHGGGRAPEEGESSRPAVGGENLRRGVSGGQHKEALCWGFTHPMTREKTTQKTEM